VEISMPVDRIADERPSAPAVTVHEGEALTFAELDRKSAQLANYLRGQGLAPGDRFGLLLDNGVNYAVCIWAARRSGLQAVPINWQLRPAEVAYIIDDSDAHALIASTRLGELATEAIAGCDVPILLADGESFGAFRSLDSAIAGEPADQPAGQPDGTPMYYSSGTTGKPKGIRRVTTLKYGEERPIERLYAQLYGISATTVMLIPAPLYFAAPFGWLSAATALGGHVVLLKRFDAEAVLQAIERYRVTHALFVPIHFVRLLKLPAEVRDRYDLSSLQTVIHAGAPCPRDVKADMIAWWGPKLHEYYSGSEGAGFTTISSQEWLERPGTVGRSVMGPVHILDDDENELPPGEVGTIWFENAARFEYHKSPEKTAGFFNARGWGSLGDLGHVDADGYLFISNRRTDLIISGGANIYPQEIENEMAAHPAVFDVAAIGVPDAEFGQTVRLLVLLHADVTPSDALKDELLSFCRSRLAGYKCPRSLIFVPSLPRLANGKLLRREIDPALYAPEAAPLAA
jgi:acyl-CoA synthetase (AMP-forming)/AMP-acid ligase II